jgi:hypothetical protein
MNTSPFVESLTIGPPSQRQLWKRPDIGPRFGNIKGNLEADVVSGPCRGHCIRRGGGTKTFSDDFVRKEKGFLLIRKNPNLQYRGLPLAAQMVTELRRLNLSISETTCSRVRIAERVDASLNRVSARTAQAGITYIVSGYNKSDLF